MLAVEARVYLDGGGKVRARANWIPYNEELEKYAEEVVAEVGSPVYGRTTYRMMESYWPGRRPNHSRIQPEERK